MSLFSFFAPPSTESDEDLVNRRIRDLTSNTDVEDAIRDIEPLARQFSSLIGVNASTALIQALTRFRNDDDMIVSILKIMNELVRDDSLESNSNAGFIINESESLLNIFECLSNQKPSIRGLALTLVKNLVRLQLPKVQSTILEDPRAQELILQLADDTNEMIRSNFLYLVPQLVQGNPEIQKCFAFRLLDWLADGIALGSSGDMFGVLQSLLEGNIQTQKLFVETGHMSKIVPALKAGDEKAAEFLLMLFTSSEATSFQKFVGESALLQPVLSQSLGSSKQRGVFWRLLGAMIKGNTDLCSAVDPELARLVIAILQSRDDREDGTYFIECYALKGAQNLTSVLCQSLQQQTVSILENFEQKKVEVANLLVCARCCLIANHDTLSAFIGSSVAEEQSFFSRVTAMIAQAIGDSVLMLAIMQFLAAGVWESGIAAEKFVESSTNVLVKLCLRATQEPLRSVVCLAVLEALLFKTKSQVFSQLVASVKTHIGVSEMVAVVDAYAKTFSDKNDVSLWSEFVQESVRVIKKNSDALLSDDVEVKSETGQVSLLQAKLTEALQENEKKQKENESLLKEIEENRQAVTNLESQLEEFSNAIEAYERILKDHQENAAIKDTENERLNNRIEKLEEQLRFGGGNSSFEERVNELTKQFEESKGQLEEDLKRLRKENEDLRQAVENLKSDDALDRLTKENRDLKQQLEKARQQINELSEIEKDYATLKEEMAGMLQQPNFTSSDNSSEVASLRAQVAELQGQLANNCSEQQITRMQEELDSVKAALETSEAKVKDLETENQETMDELERALDEKDAVTAKLGKKKEKIKRIRSEQANESVGVEELRLKLEQQQEELDRKESEIEAQKEKYNATKQGLLEQLQEKDRLLEASQNSTERQKEELAAKCEEDMARTVEALEDTFNQKLKAKSDRIEEIEAELTEKTQELTEKCSRLSELENQLKKQSQEFEDKSNREREMHEKEVAELTATIKARETRIEKLSAPVPESNTQELEIRKFRENEAVLIEKISKLEAQYAIQTKERNALEERIKTAQASHESEVDQLKSEVQKLNVALEEEKKKFTKQEAKTKKNETEQQEQIKRLQQEKAELVSRIEEANVNQEERQAEKKQTKVHLQTIQDQQSELTALKLRAQEKDQTIAALSKELASLKEQINTLAKSEQQQKLLCEDLRKEKATAEQTIAKQLEEITEAQSEVEQRNKEISRLKAQTEKLSDTETREHSLESELQKLNKQNEALSSEIVELKSKRNAQDKEIEKLKKEISKLKLPDDALQRQNEEIAELKSTAAQKEKNIRKLNDDLLKAKAQIKKLTSASEEKSNSLQNEITALKSDIESRDDTIKKQRSEIERLQKKTSPKKSNEDNSPQLKKVIEDQRAEIEQLKLSSTKQESKIRELTSTISKLAKQLKDKESDEPLRSELTRLTAELESKDQELSESNDKIKQLSAQLKGEHSQERYEELEKKHRQLQRKLLELEMQNETENKEEANGEEVKRLRAELKKKKSELATCKSTIDDLNTKLTLKSAKAKSRKQELESLYKFQVNEPDQLQVKGLKSQLYEMKLQVEKFRGEIDSGPEGDIVETLKRHVSAIVADADIQRQRNDVQEMELKQLRVQNTRKSDEVRKCKRTAEKAVKMASKMQKDYERMKVTVARQTDRVTELEEELRIMTEEDSKLQKRHQSALRLIGELWTRNQTLSRRSSPMSDKSTTRK